MDFSRHPQQRSVRDTPGRLSLSEIPRDFPAEEQVLTPNMGQRGTLDPEGVELELLRRGLYDLERLCTRQKGTENSLPVAEALSVVQRGFSALERCRINAGGKDRSRSCILV